MPYDGHIKHLTTKIIRTTHRVTFSRGTAAGALSGYLKQVPETARVIDIEEENDDLRWISTTLVFEDEQEQAGDTTH